MSKACEMVAKAIGDIQTERNHAAARLERVVDTFRALVVEYGPEDKVARERMWNVAEGAEAFIEEKKK